MKRIISLMLTLALSAGCIPVIAAEDSAAVSAAGMPEGIEWEPEDLGESGVATPVPVANIEAEDMPVLYQEPDNEPIVHTETVDTMFEFPEEDEDLMPHEMPGPEDLNMFALNSDDKDVWRSLYAKMFGNDYLSPYMGAKDGQQVTGNTNRLVIEETDLTLPGKNGLDVVIKRKYDNQDYKRVYSYYVRQTHEVSTMIYVYGFRNTSTNEVIYVGFLSPDLMHSYMYNGCYIEHLYGIGLSTGERNGVTTKYYDFRHLQRNITDDTTCQRYEYDSSISEIKTYSVGNTNNTIDNRRVLIGNSYLSESWDLQLPEAYIYRYESLSGGNDAYSTYEEGLWVRSGILTEMCICLTDPVNSRTIKTVPLRLSTRLPYHR